MSVQTPVDKTSPLWKAWEAYKVTEHYANTKKWAATSHVEGSLWAAFERGFAAAAVERGVRETTDDTARLDWIEARDDVWFVPLGGSDEWLVRRAVGEDDDTFFPSLRAAIDAARESETARSGRRDGDSA